MEFDTLKSGLRFLRYFNGSIPLLFLVYTCYLSPILVAQTVSSIDSNQEFQEYNAGNIVIARGRILHENVDWNGDGKDIRKFTYLLLRNKITLRENPPDNDVDVHGIVKLMLMGDNLLAFPNGQQIEITGEFIFWRGGSPAITVRTISKSTSSNSISSIDVILKSQSLSEKESVLNELVNSITNRVAIDMTAQLDPNAAIASQPLNRALQDAKAREIASRDKMKSSSLNKDTEFIALIRQKVKQNKQVLDQYKYANFKAMSSGQLIAYFTLSQVTIDLENILKW